MGRAQSRYSLDLQFLSSCWLIFLVPLPVQCYLLCVAHDFSQPQVDGMTNKFQYQCYYASTSFTLWLLHQLITSRFSPFFSLIRNLEKSKTPILQAISMFILAAMVLRILICHTIYIKKNLKCIRVLGFLEKIQHPLDTDKCIHMRAAQQLTSSCDLYCLPWVHEK